MAFPLDFNLKPLKVDTSAFHPGSGGGGGSAYMGRQPQAPEAEDEAEEPETAGLAGDACDFKPNWSSKLTLIPRVEAAPVDLDALEEELKGRVRYLLLAVSHLERSLDRRTSAIVGCVTVA